MSKKFRVILCAVVFACVCALSLTAVFVTPQQAADTSADVAFAATPTSVAMAEGYKSKYYVDEALPATLPIVITYDDGTTSTAEIESSEITGFSTQIVGSHTASFSYLVDGMESAIEVEMQYEIAAAVTITFAGGDGATGSVESITAVAGREITLPRNGFEKIVVGIGKVGFWRWDDGTNKYAVGDKYTVPDRQNSLTFTAVWLPSNVYNIYNTTSTNRVVTVGEGTSAVTLYNGTDGSVIYTLMDNTRSSTGKAGDEGATYLEANYVFGNAEDTSYEWFKNINRATFKYGTYNISGKLGSSVTVDAGVTVNSVAFITKSNGLNIGGSPYNLVKVLGTLNVTGGVIGTDTTELASITSSNSVFDGRTIENHGILNVKGAIVVNHTASAVYNEPNKNAIATIESSYIIGGGSGSGAFPIQNYATGKVILKGATVTNNSAERNKTNSSVTVSTVCVELRGNVYTESTECLTIEGGAIGDILCHSTYVDGRPVYVDIKITGTALVGSVNMASATNSRLFIEDSQILGTLKGCDNSPSYSGANSKNNSLTISNSTVQAAGTTANLCAIHGFKTASLTGVTVNATGATEADVGFAVWARNLTIGGTTDINGYIRTFNNTTNSVELGSGFAFQSATDTLHFYGGTLDGVKVKGGAAYIDNITATSTNATDAAIEPEASGTDDVLLARYLKITYVMTKCIGTNYGDTVTLTEDDYSLAADFNGGVLPDRYRYGAESSIALPSRTTLTSNGLILGNIVPKASSGTDAVNATIGGNPDDGYTLDLTATTTDKGITLNVHWLQPKYRYVLTAGTTSGYRMSSVYGYWSTGTTQVNDIYLNTITDNATLAAAMEACDRDRVLTTSGTGVYGEDDTDYNTAYFYLGTYDTAKTIVEGTPFETSESINFAYGQYYVSGTLESTATDYAVVVSKKAKLYINSLTVNATVGNGILLKDTASIATVSSRPTSEAYPLASAAKAALTVQDSAQGGSVSFNSSTLPVYLVGGTYALVANCKVMLYKPLYVSGTSADILVTGDGYCNFFNGSDTERTYKVAATSDKASKTVVSFGSVSLYNSYNSNFTYYLLDADGEIATGAAPVAQHASESYDVKYGWALTKHEGENTTESAYLPGDLLDTPTTPDGYDFVGWYTSSNFASDTIVTDTSEWTGSKEIWAKFSVYAWEVNSTTSTAKINWAYFTPANEADENGQIYFTDETDEKGDYIYIPVLYVSNYVNGKTVGTVIIEIPDDSVRLIIGTIYSEYSTNNYSVLINVFAESTVDIKDYVSIETLYLNNRGEFAAYTISLSYDFVYRSPRELGVTQMTITNRCTLSKYDYETDTEMPLSAEELPELIVIPRSSEYTYDGTLDDYVYTGLYTGEVTRDETEGYLTGGVFSNAVEGQLKYSISLIFCQDDEQWNDEDTIRICSGDSGADCWLFEDYHDAFLDNTFRWERTTLTLPEYRGNMPAEGYEFKGWQRIIYPDATGGGTSYEDYSPNYVFTYENVYDYGYADFAPKFALINYDITYSLDGGTVATANPTSYTVETNTFTLNNPTKVGYTFKGWSGTGLTGDENTEVSVAIGSSGDRSYVANWTLNTHAVTVAEKDANTATLEISETTATVAYGTVVTVTATANIGYSVSFVVYKTGDETTLVTVTDNKFTMPDFPVTVEATSTIINFTFTYAYNGATGGNSATSISADYGTAAGVQLAVPTRTGYTFDGWFFVKDASTSQRLTDADGITNLAVDDTAIALFGNYFPDATSYNYPLTAKWTANTNTPYVVRCYAETLEQIAGADIVLYNGVYYKSHIVVNKTGTTDTTTNEAAPVDSRLNGFNMRLNGIIQTNIDGDGTAEVKIYFLRKTYSIDFYSDPAMGTVTANKNQIKKYEAAITIATVVPEAGYNFTGWKEHYSSVYPDENYDWRALGTRYFIAQYELINFNISYETYGGALDNGKTNPNTYTVETVTFTLNNPTKTGYSFEGWAVSPTLEDSVQTVTIQKGSSGDKHYYAKYSPLEYDLTYENLNGATNTNPAKHQYDRVTTLAAPGARTGYAFAGWALTSDGDTITQIGKTDITANQKVYAKWTAITYNVAFNKNFANATGEMSNQTFTYDAAQTLTANAFERTGYAFAGWNTKADGTGTDYTDAQSVQNLAATQDATVNLYAKWTANTYTVTYNVNGGNTLSPDTKVVTYDAAYTLATPTHANPLKHFGGWYNGNDAVDTSGTWTIASNVTLVAQWNDYRTYQVTFVGGEGATGSVAAQNIREDYPVTLPANGFAKQGYHFDKWSDGTNDYEVGSEYTVTEAVEFTAIWAPNTDTAYLVKHYQQNLADDDYVIVSADTENMTGTTAADTAAVAKSYTGFTAKTIVQKTIAADGSTVVEIYYDLNVYNVTFDLDGKGTSNDTLVFTGIRHGASVTTPSVIANTGYTVKSANGGWNTAVAATVTATVTYTAQYDLVSYTIGYTLNGGTVATANPTSYNIETATFTLTNPTKVGYDFDGWTYEGQATPQKTVTIAKGSTGNKAYTANWTAINYTITFKTDANTVFGTPVTTAHYGDTIVLPTSNPTKTADNTYTYDFASWQGYTAGMTVSENHTFVATFTPTFIDYVITFMPESGDTPISVMNEHYGATVNTPTAPDKDGYRFMGWTPEVTTVSANATYTAVYVQVVTISVEGGTVNNGTDSTASVDKDGNVTVNAAPAAEGKQFKAWVDSDGNEVSNNSTYTFAATEAVTLRAVYEDIPAAVAPEKDGLSGGAIAGIVIGSLAGVGIGGFLFFKFKMKKKLF